MIQLLVDVVDGAACCFDTCIEGLFLGVEAGKCLEQARVDVDDLVWERLHERWREKPHVSGEADELDTAFG